MEVSMCRLYRARPSSLELRGLRSSSGMAAQACRINHSKPRPKKQPENVSPSPNSHPFITSHFKREARSVGQTGLDGNPIFFLVIKWQFSNWKLIWKDQMQYPKLQSLLRPKSPNRECKWFDTISALCNTKHLPVANFAQLLFRRKWYKHKSKCF